MRRLIDMPRLALSIRQPWAWAILHAGKDIENRDWPTKFRGRFCIHAAKGLTRAEYEYCLAAIHAISEEHPFPRDLALPGEMTLPDLNDLQRGGIVGTAEIADCVTASASPWFCGRFGFVLRNIEPVDFIPVKGALGFFDWQSRRIKSPAAM